jgi:hypothetical protein
MAMLEGSDQQDRWVEMDRLSESALDVAARQPDVPEHVVVEIGEFPDLGTVPQSPGIADDRGYDENSHSSEERRPGGVENGGDKMGHGDTLL